MMKKNRDIKDILSQQRVSKMLRDLHPEAEDIKLYLWQQDAVGSWKNENQENVKGQNFVDKEWFGIIQAVTGAGKTILALECANVWLQTHPTGNITILVPTRALQHQWRRQLQMAFNEPIGVLGGGRRDWQQINVVTVDTAAKGLPETAPDHLIIADECHNLGSQTRKYAVINNPHNAILGLSATPQREDSGLGMVSYLCGPVVHTYGYTEGRADGVIIPFTVRAVKVPLTSEERKKYLDYTDDIKAISFILRQRYGDTTNFFAIKPGQNGEEEDGLLTSFKNLCQARKRVLNESFHRFSCVDAILDMHPDLRAMLFHQRINQLEWMHSKYTGVCPPHLPDLINLEEDKKKPKIWVGTSWEEAGIEPPDVSRWLDEPVLAPTIYHGEMKRKDQDQALQDFKDGKSRLLMSCKALTEGVDVPDADLGIMVSGTNATRARVQTLGRCLRRGSAEKAIIYLLFIDNTTDVKGLTNLKYNGKLPSGSIEFWRYDGENMIFESAEEEEGETDAERERKARTPKTRDHICDKCHKEYFTKEHALSENHHCSIIRTRDGRRGVDIWSKLRLG